MEKWRYHALHLAFVAIASCAQAQGMCNSNVIARAEVLLQKKRFETALRVFQRELHRSPKCAAAALGCADAYLAMADTTRALMCYNHVIRLDGNDCRPFLAKYYIERARHQDEAAQADLHRAEKRGCKAMIGEKP